MPYAKPLIEVLLESARPVFLFGSTPPKEGTPLEKAKETCAKFANRSAVLATDGFIVYDIQDEGARTELERPFPFRKTMDPALYASFFPKFSGKECIVYKCVTEENTDDFCNWLENASTNLNHHSFALVGAASSRDQTPSIGLATAAKITKTKQNVAFGCVCIAERHTMKHNENVNMFNKVALGAEWFITQGIFDAEPAIKMINDYADLCREKGIVPKKVILTFAPCGRAKTMTFIKWLGMNVPEEVEQRIFAAENPVHESVILLKEILSKVLEHTGGSGVPIGLNVESLSIFKEEIDAAHDLFQLLQTTLLNSKGSPWAVRWFYVRSPTGSSPYYADNTGDNNSNQDLNKLIQIKDRDVVNPSSSSSSSSNDNKRLVYTTIDPSTTSVAPLQQQQQQSRNGLALAKPIVSSTTEDKSSNVVNSHVLVASTISLIVGIVIGGTFHRR